MFIIRAFKEEGGIDVFSMWRDNSSGKAMAVLDAKITYLRQQKREGWTRPLYDTLDDGVGEVRFKVSKVQHRALGFFGPARDEFTFLLFATKTKRFDPPDAISRAVALRKRVELDHSLSVKLLRWDQK